MAPRRLFTTDSVMAARPHHHPAMRWLLLIAGLASIGVVIGKVSETTPSTTDLLAPPGQLEALVPPASTEESLPSASPTAGEGHTAEHNTASSEPAEPPQRKSIHVVVEKGATLSSIFANLDLPARELHKIIELGGAIKELICLRPGELITFDLSDEHQLQKISYDLNHASTLHVIRNEDGTFSTEIEKHPLEYRQTLGQGVIKSSFYQAAVDSGLPEAMVLKLAEIFGWKINFLTDIQEGDSFSILYEKVYKDGQPVTTGNILAATFINNGRTFKAVRYTDSEGKTGYYTPEGKSLTRGFLRYPVEFSRISSRFSKARLHPILHTVRAHKGVDFAAPTGTPIHAVADGKITYQGWKGGYGNVVIIQHDDKYSTVYGHMSRFNSKLKQGSRIKQGEVIGYVGATGYATGPHLHYEFRIHGVHHDPLTVELPEAHPIAAKERERFLREATALLARMEQMEGELRTASVPPAELATTQD